MLDQLLMAYGDVRDYTWEELQRFEFRHPGRFGASCRIPALVEVFDLHRRYGGLLHLDIKRPGFDRAIADLLERMDLWDHVAYCNQENGGVLLRDPRLQLRSYKAGLYLDHSEVFPDAIVTALKKPGNGVIVGDPRGVAVARGRRLGPLSRAPVGPARPARRLQVDQRFEAELIAQLRNADDWDQVANVAAVQAASAARIRVCAVAEQLRIAKTSSPAAFAALEERVRRRSLHQDWRYHGLDGAAALRALRALLELRAPNALDVARFALWRDDPALEQVADPRWKNPRAWTDFRVKMVVWPALEKGPSPTAAKLCWDYLGLNDEDATKLGPLHFEQAARVLLATSPQTATALAMLRHRLQVVRGRAVLECLAHAQEAWTRSALEIGVPHALAWRVDK